MQTFNCPSCGAQITFQSSITLSCVCAYCRSLVVRHDKDVEVIGTMAELPQDISPFQIGTSGKYKGLTFTLIGRMKIGWEDGCWNEWFMYADDGRRGWLAEAQGFLAVSFEEDVPADSADFQTLQKISHQAILGQAIKLKRGVYTIADVKDAECLGSEGELPFPAPKGRVTRAIDLLGVNGGFAGVESDESGKIRLYVGDYVEFDDLKFTFLRDLPGWKVTRPPMANPASQKRKSNG